MKTQISRRSYNSEKRYSGVYQQQGRMLTDADWNTLVDLIKHRLDDALDDVIGAGTPRRRPLQLRLDGSDLKLIPGYLYVDGIAAQLMGEADEAEIDYAQQPDLNAPRELPSDCVLYADVWERTVTALEDPELMDSALHGADTCTRRQTQLQVKWCDTNDNPESFPATGDGRLTVTIREGITTSDLCDPCAAEVAVNAKSGNALFRLEVHHAIGNESDPLQSVEKVWLKWSAENGAEQYALHDAEGNDLEPPSDFIDDLHSYEFFTTETERNLGLHSKGTPLPLRGELVGGYLLPESGKPRDYVRRWDGYCVLEKISDQWAIIQGQDRTMQDFLTSPEVSLDPATDILRVGLESIQFEFAVEDKKLFAGDYWTVPLREREFQAELERKAADPSYVIPPLLDNAVCRGVEHHYLNLGRMTAGILEVNPELDRRYAFPRLTELTRLFIAGGDGQNIVPGKPLPEMLRVGVANGEWPVVGATVRFEMVEGAGSLTPANGLVETNSAGIAECTWQPGPDPEKNYRVRAVLVDPDFPVGVDHDQLPPVYFSAHLLSGDEVAYTPACGDTENTDNTVHNLLAENELLKPGEYGYYRVSEVLDALLCELDARHIPYQANACAITPSLQSALKISAGSHHNVNEILHKLLCELTASEVPLNRNDESLCDTLKDNNSVQTVQDAINALCRMERGSGCSVTVGEGGQFKTLKEAFGGTNAKASESALEVSEICICLLPGEHLIEKLKVSGKSIRITGCGAAASRITLNGGWKMEAEEIVLRDLSITMIDPNSSTATGDGYLVLEGVINARCIVEHCQFSRTFGGNSEQRQPMVTVRGRVQMDWRANNLFAYWRDLAIGAAVLPDDEGLDEDAQDLRDALKQLWLVNPYVNPERFAELARDTARQIMEFSDDSRTQLFQVGNIERLDALLDWVDAEPIMVANFPSAAHPLGEATLSEVVKAFYQDILSPGVDDFEQVVNRLEVIARRTTIYDEALALASSHVGGVMVDNIVQGNLSLFRDTDPGVPLVWDPIAPSTVSQSNAAWAAGKRREQISAAFDAAGSSAPDPVYLEASGTLELRGNTFNVVSSWVTEEQLSAFNSILTDTELVAPVMFPGYETLVLRDNILLGLSSSLIAKSLRLDGNEFRAGIKDEHIVAYTLSEMAILVGNQALRSFARIEVMAQEVAEKANLVVVHETT